MAVLRLIEILCLHVFISQNASLIIKKISLTFLGFFYAVLIIELPQNLITYAGALSPDDLNLFTALYREHCEVSVKAGQFVLCIIH